MNNQRNQSGFTRAIKKFFLSAFTIVTFIAYALHNRSAYTPGTAQAVPPTGGGANPPQTFNPSANNNSGSAAQAQPAAPTNTNPAQQQAAPTETPAPSQLVFGNDNGNNNAAPAAPTATAPAQQAAPAQNGQYKDGTYTGPEVDVRYGLVQVQAVIQNGKIANVQFTEYPQDRRTSQRINAVAVPELQQEAVQAQSANVNLITGATLTSEGFQESLQAALSQAQQ